MSMLKRAQRVIQSFRGRSNHGLHHRRAGLRYFEVLEDRCLLAGGSLTAGLDFGGLTVDPQTYDPSRILVRFRSEAGSLGGTEVGAGFALVPGLHKVRLADGVSVTDALAAYRANPAVLYAEPDYTVGLTTAVIPNDPQFASLWGLHNTGQTGGTPDADIDAPEAWTAATGSSSVVVGVIDTGADYTHPDLAANVWTNPGEIAGDGLDNDANGFIDDVHGYDFFNNDGDPFDDNGHGTHVSGTIGAVGNNSVGVVGVNWNAQIMALKFLGSGGSGSTSGAIAAINYATMMRQHGVNIRLTNNSWGGGGYSQALHDAIQASGASGMLFVAAAGNAGADNDSALSYPASYDLDNIIAVAATDHTDALASFSNYGATTVDLGAPGVGILSTTPGNTYRWFSGTSMASPHVAGVAALAWSVSPTATYQQVRDAIFTGADPVAGLNGLTLTGRRLNAWGTLQELGLTVAGSSPAAGNVVADPPTDFVVDFSDPYDPATVDAGDLTVNGIAANSYILTDADSVTFHFAASPVTTQGVQYLALAEGAVARLSDSDPLAAFHATFRYDAVPLQVTATLPAEASVVALPLTTLEVHFNEPYDAASVGVDDLALSQGWVTGFSLVDADTVRYTLDGLAEEGTLTIDLAAGAVTDAFGNAGPAYSGSIVLDYATRTLPAPLLVAPTGALVYEFPISGFVSFAGDTDSFTVDLDAGQTLTVAVTPAAGQGAHVELFGQGLFTSASSPVPGNAAVLQLVTVTAPGTYTITVSGLGATTGPYALRAILNAAVEEEEHGGPANDSLATAQDIDGSFLPLAGAATHGAVLGSVGLSHQYASMVIDFSSEWSPTEWSAAQALGPPDTFVYGDLPAAWSPLPENGTAEYLTLGFDTPVFADGVMIRETYGNGFVTQVDVLDTSDVLHTVWSGVDRSVPGSPVNFFVSWPATSFLVKGVKIHVNTDHDLGAWEEIDAVQLHTASPPGDVADYYAFTLGEGQSMTLALMARAPGAIVLELQDAAGTTLATGAPAGGFDAVVNNFAAPAGTYYVRITSDPRADYQLVVTRDAAFDTEANDSPASAQALPASGLALGAVRSRSPLLAAENEPNDDGLVGVSLADLALANDWSGSFVWVEGDNYQAGLTGAIHTGWDGDWDFFKILASPGDSLSVSLDGISLGDPFLFLFDNTGTLLAFDDDGGNDLNALLTFSAFAYAGDYYLVADSFDEDAGSYALTATLTTPNLLTLPDDDLYSFTVDAGGRFTITTATPGDGPLQFVNVLDPALDVFDPDGTLVTGDDNGAADGRNAQLTYVALVSGTYTVRVRAAAASAGEYVLHVDLNHAPTLSGSASLFLTAIAEDTVDNPGTLVAELLGSESGNPITDADADAMAGIAVVGMDEANGRWEFSTDGGASWARMGAVSDGTARLLAADALTRVRFVPNTDFAGAAAITFRAWDQTNGMNGASADTNTHGGSTAFSAAVATGSLTVRAVNDAPSFRRGPDLVVSEDAGTLVVPGWAADVSPGPADEAGQGLRFVVIGNTNPGLFAAGPVVSSDGTLSFIPAANAHGSAVITLVLWDDGGTVGGGQDVSASQTFTLTVVSVNDRPDFAASDPAAVLEDAGAQVFAGWAAFDAGAANEAGQLATYTVSNVSNPALFAVGPRVADDGTLTFTPAANASGSATFAVTVRDNGGGADTSVTRTFTITVAAVTDVASLRVLPASGREGSAIPLEVSAAVTDADGSESLSIWISGVPTLSLLNRGISRGDGNWELSPAELTGLTITSPDNGVLDLTVTAIAWEAVNGSAERTSQSLRVTVVNVPPTVTISGAGTIHPFAPYQLTLASSDPGADAIQNWMIDWGDTAVETLAGNPGSVTHAYPGRCGSYTIRATAVDDDGAYGATVGVRADFGSRTQCYVAEVYFDLLGRAAEPAGLAAWSELLDQGHPRAEIMRAIQRTPEYGARVVRALYNEVLHRAPDPLGLNGWVEFLVQGGTADRLRGLLFSSEEYFARQGGTVAGFLQGLYQGTLGRDLDEAGLAGWSQALAGGMTRAAVVSAVLGSRESDAREVQGLYNQYLRRATDAAGEDAWVSLLQQGVPNEEIVVALLASEEYFARSQAS